MSMKNNLSVAEQEELLRFARASFRQKSSSQAALVPAPRLGRLPLSFAQQRLWFLAQIGGASKAYHFSAGYRLKGKLDREVLQRAFDRIVARHEVLRTTFAVVDGQPEQRIAAAEDSRFALVEKDLRTHSHVQGELERQIAEEVCAPFDLETGPLLRGRLMRLAETDYVLMIVMHHVVTDGWSKAILLNELGVLYGAFLRGEADPLPELSVQYADYAVWQRRRVQGDGLSEHALYWKQELAGAPASLELPGDHPRPRVKDYVGASLRVELDAKLTARLRELGLRHGATLYMTLLAAWAVLLSRLSGQQEVVIGTPVANRGLVEVEKLIGFFVNTLALRLSLEGSPTVGELLRRVKTRVLAGLTHQDLPFEQVVELTQPDRSLGHSPLFQVMLAWQNEGEGKPELPGLEVQAMPPVQHGAAKFDLTLEMAELQGKVIGELEYSTALFERATAERYLEYFRTLLEGMAENDRERIGRLPLLSERDQQQMVSEWNRTERDYRQEKCVHELFEEQAEKTAEAVALEYEGGSLSYSELNRRANQLAYFLRAKGVAPERRVGLCLERGWEMVVGLLGVLKAGGAYVPLDPQLPMERLQYMVQDSGPVVVLTQARLRSVLAGIGSLPVVELDSEMGVWQGSEGAGSNLGVAGGGWSAHQLAYVIYTSGSTGVPKGVMVEHGGLTNRMLWMQEAYGLGAGDVVLQKTPYGFDISGWEFYWPLITGARLVMARPEGHKDPEYLCEVIREKQITALHFVPSMLGMFLEHVERRGKQESCRTLRLLVCGGEELGAGLVQRLQRLMPWIQVENLYGPTETTVDSTAWSCPPGFARSTVPIGRPIANTRVYVLDSALQLVPVGIPGELYLGGVGLARGYRGKPDLTAERFIPDAFSGQVGARLYRTGDQARYLADGNVDFLGRNDFQVKIRGCRIELGEIQAVLSQHPAVEEAAVLALQEGPDDKRLVAYVHTRRSLEKGELREFLRQRVPEYMVPSAFVEVEQMPLNSNGKLDRKRLPVPAAAKVAEGQGVLSNRTPIQQKLHDLWSRLLKVSEIGIDDSFFDLGGHSLLALRLMEEVQEAFQVQLPLRSLFTPPTIAGLAEKIEAALSGDEDGSDETEVDFDLEASLDPSITLQRELPMAAAPATILLTGATGFIGSFLLSELLQRTQANVYCLVRAASRDEGTVRLQRQMERLDLWQPHLESRITVVSGDLSSPRFGLSQAQYDELAETTDTIYHSGAWVSFLYPYRVLKPANVLGTEEILRLACLHKTKLVHFISTIGVFPQSSPFLPPGEQDWIMKEDDVPNWQGLDLGYSQSKWVAERLVSAAGSRGLPVAIYRPSNAYGHAETGDGNSHDFLYRFIYGCGQMRCVPDIEWDLNLVPVDFVARAIAELSLGDGAIGGVFHLVNDASNSMRDITNCIASSGRAIERIPYQEWRTRLLLQTQENALAVLAGGFPETDPQATSRANGHPRRSYCADHAARQLRPKGVTCPTVTEAKLQKYVSQILDVAMRPA
jgi:amino acid adenylation domain-containing protein/thioester reductase-like protein